jgi:hypothetical protein
MCLPRVQKIMGLSAVDQTKHYEIGISCLSIKHAVFMSKNKQNLNWVSIFLVKWSVCICVNVATALAEGCVNKLHRYG